MKRCWGLVLWELGIQFWLMWDFFSSSSGGYVEKGGVG